MIESVGYDPDEKELQIEFNSGNVITYYDVPANVYNEFIQSESKGRYFHYFIKDSYSWD